MAVDLRPYQADIVARFYASPVRRSLIVCPVGSGKTTIAAAIIDRWPGRVLFVADRQELTDQAFARCGPGTGLLIGPRLVPAEGKVTVVGIHTVSRRDIRLDADLVIVDEAHMAAAATFRKVLSWYPEARVAGLTATCYRMAGSLADLFDDVIAGPSVEELQALGYLAPVVVYSDPRDVMLGARVRAGEFSSEDMGRMMQPAVIRDAVGHWRRITGGNRKTIAFACTKAHALALAEEIGHGAETVTEDTPTERRRTARDRILSGESIALVSVTALGVGFDLPALEVGLMCRPTLSRGWYRQMAGRIMRTAPGKPRATMLDCAGLVMRHGLPTAPDLTTLDGKVVPIPKRGTLLGLANCPTCLLVNQSDVQVCPGCGTRLEKKKRVIRTVAGTLDEVIGIAPTPAQAFAQQASQSQQVRLLAKWIREGRQRGWKPGAAPTRFKGTFHRWPSSAERQQAEALA